MMGSLAGADRTWWLSRIFFFLSENPLESRLQGNTGTCYLLVKPLFNCGPIWFDLFRFHVCVLIPFGLNTQNVAWEKAAFMCFMEQRRGFVYKQHLWCIKLAVFNLTAQARRVEVNHHRMKKVLEKGRGAFAYPAGAVNWNLHLIRLHQRDFTPGKSWIWHQTWRITHTHIILIMRE